MGRGPERRHHGSHLRLLSPELPSPSSRNTFVRTPSSILLSPETHSSALLSPFSFLPKHIRPHSFPHSPSSRNTFVRTPSSILLPPETHSSELLNSRLLSPEFNTSKTGEIEIGGRFPARCKGKKPRPFSKTAHIAMRNGSFCIAKRHVSGAKTARLASPERGVLGAILSDFLT